MIGCVRSHSFRGSSTLLRPLLVRHVCASHRICIFGMPSMHHMPSVHTCRGSSAYTTGPWWYAPCRCGVRVAVGWHVRSCAPVCAPVCSTHVYAHAHMHTHLCMHICTHIRACTYAHTFVHAHVTSKASCDIRCVQMLHSSFQTWQRVCRMLSIRQMNVHLQAASMRSSRAPAHTKAEC